MGLTPARKIAFEVLRRVESEGAYASDLLHSALNSTVKPADAALATELTLGVLRWRRLLDFLLDQQLKTPVARLDLPVALALRIGIYQLRFLHRIPASAAVNESAQMVKVARKTSAAALINAVLRRSAAHAKRPPEELLPTGIAQSERLAILHSHPAWMIERWLAHLGETRTIALLHANNRAPRLSCAVHDPARHDEIVAALGRARLRVEPGVLLKSAFAVSGGSPARTELFRQGLISIQDEASQAVPLLLDVQTGDRVLDACAAPGGKTAPLARAAGSAGLIVAADRHSHRLRAMRTQCERIGLRRVHLVELDGEKPLPFRPEFHRVLADVPCSGTGTLARHPEIRWRLQPEQLAEFHRLQTAILASALAALTPGGRLVYSTCSLEPEENDDVVAEALRADPSVRRIPAPEAARMIEKHLAPGIDAATLFDPEGQFRTVPGEWQTDGFFAAILEKRTPGAAHSATPALATRPFGSVRGC